MSKIIVLRERNKLLLALFTETNLKEFGNRINIVYTLLPIIYF